MVLDLKPMSELQQSLPSTKSERWRRVLLPQKGGNVVSLLRRGVVDVDGDRSLIPLQDAVAYQGSPMKAHPKPPQTASIRFHKWLQQRSDAVNHINSEDPRTVTMDLKKPLVVEIGESVLFPMWLHIFSFVVM